jgi:2',3'-cyclic-nucleotide 2'-phosphodiesterase (5'-nucleotidase family)
MVTARKRSSLSEFGSTKRTVGWLAAGPSREPPRSGARKPTALLLLSLMLACFVAVSACEGCRGTTGPTAPQNGSADEAPSARLYLVSDLAGALEPCGCVKDQLGGIEHFGALVTSEKKAAPAYATLSAGPLFFMDMELTPEKKSQDVAKAETIAAAMKTLGLGAFAPSRNGFAAGAATLAKLRDTSGAAMVAANLQGGGAKRHTMLDVGGMKIGVIGVAAPDKNEKAPKTAGTLDGVTSSPAIPAVKESVTALKNEGAQAIIVLAAVGRGEAKRIADDNPELLAILVGSTGASGDENTKPAAPEQIGNVLIIETANHLQTVGVLDLHLHDAAREKRKIGLVKFADGTGLERMRKRDELNGRIDELRKKIATWETDKSVDPKDVAARKGDVARLESERDALDKAPAPSTGSFYRFSMKEIRDQLGDDQVVKSQMATFYKKVNDDNKAAFKDKKPPPAAKGEASYVGVDMCANCHEPPKNVWDGTGHAHAYATLEKQYKEANLDCVACHVTGYEKPGGSTVTHVADFKDVQCEVCHGPGSLHAAKPKQVKIPVAKPAPEMCLECHHPPHVHTFDAKVKMAEILGPGHGKPLPSP